MATKKSRTDAVEIVHRRHYVGRSKRLRELRSARASASIARKIYHLRAQAGLTQKQLAERVGTSHSVISRLEDDDYEGHSLSMLQRIAAALGARVEVRFVRLRPRV